MSHPLRSIPVGKKLPVFLGLLAATLVLLLVLTLSGPFSPNIVDYELAGSAAKAAGIIGAWDATARIQAGFSLGLDFLYMLVYSTTIALACLWGATVLRSKGWRAIGILLAWGLWLAALLDAVENFALATMLFSNIAEPYPLVAKICALGKFGLILLGLAYCALAAVIRIFVLIRPVQSRTS
ncbi:MAG: hypothetical protein JXA01_04025 [Dehalococcoidia bacterium]|nr:hypothetical protein [Dehalococcoidia bacterium]